MPKRVKKRKAVLESVVKQEVFEAVMRILKAHGPKDLTLDMVAHEAGMATSTLYNYFDNRADLLAYMIMRLFEPVLQKMDGIFESDLPVVEKLRLIAKMHLHARNERSQFIGLLNEESSPAATRSLKEIQQRRAISIGKLLKTMNDGMEQGIFRKTSATCLMLAFTGILEAFFEYRAMSPDPVSIQDDVDNVMEAFMEGAKPRKR